MSPSEDRAPVRSYQRIFRPERRIYQVEGHRLPVPGGVPLRWLGYAIGALLAVIALSTRSPLLVLGLAAATATAGLLLGGGLRQALIAAGAVFGAAVVAGWLLASLDWPMRLLVLPALVGTLATQATPDGRAAHRFARSWLTLQLAPERRTLHRPLPAAGEPVSLAGELTVAPDHHGRQLRRARIDGPATVGFEQAVSVGRRPLRRHRWARSRRWRGAQPEQRVEVAAGERLEVGR